MAPSGSRSPRRSCSPRDRGCVPPNPAFLCPLAQKNPTEFPGEGIALPKDPSRPEKQRRLDSDVRGLGFFFPFLILSSMESSDIFPPPATAAADPRGGNEIYGDKSQFIARCAHYISRKYTEYLKILTSTCTPKPRATPGVGYEQVRGGWGWGDRPAPPPKNTMQGEIPGPFAAAGGISVELLAPARPLPAVAKGSGSAGGCGEDSPAPSPPPSPLAAEQSGAAHRCRSPRGFPPRPAARMLSLHVPAWDFSARAARSAVFSPLPAPDAS